MKKLSVLPIVLSFFYLITGCNQGEHLITDKSYRKKVEKQFTVQKELAKHRSEQLFDVFNEDLTIPEEEALKFLYAYMPLSDLADYDGQFYLKNIRSSLAARDTFSWGKKVPGFLFLRFVLPVRVNNENLDSSRWVFFSELKDRIKKMPMKEAVLEVNHWCHEKVTYKSTDVRTSSPLATVKTAFGRCGEESTFTVAALRSVGIPARQCYTPRWAHSDDNHAWVEVWVDGTWHYLGACEPEPDLDMAWFTSPAKRAMLVSTNVFGDYEGDEDILIRDPRFTRINILPNYAKTKRIYARVIDGMNKPVDSATIEFLLYNYAEFYPLHRTLTDKNGLCSLLTGYGDLVLWASRNGLYGYQKISVSNSDTVMVKISRKPGKEYSEIFDLVPPSEENITNTLSDSLKNENSTRIEFENRIRFNYESTFIDSSKCSRLAGILKVNADTLWHFLKTSRGNWREIIGFISDVPEENKSLVFSLLENISEKDIRDISPEAMADNILNSQKFIPLTTDKELFSRYILSPRIDNELLKPFKSKLQTAFSNETIEMFRKNPQTIAEWIKSNINIDNNANYSRAPLTPSGCFEIKAADPHSRDILFVAMCRSFGIPSRLEPSTKVPQYFKKEKWLDIYFEKPIPVDEEKGQIVLIADPQNTKKEEYFTNFTIEKFSDGFFRSLDYEFDQNLKTFPCTLEVRPGFYLVVTGNRIPGGTVLVRLSYFPVEKDKTTCFSIQLRDDPAPPVTLGILDLKNFLPDISSGEPVKVRPYEGTVISWIEPEKEPTKHFISDLKQRKQQFNKWPGNIILLFRNGEEKMSFITKNKDLPSRIQYLTANPAAIHEVISAVHKPGRDHLPVVIFLNKRGEILYFSEGYRIGIADDLMKFMTHVIP